MNESKALDKIQKLLALGADNSGATDQERETAMRMAHNLMLKHNIDQSRISKETKKQEARVIVRGQFFGRPWARQVSAAIAKLFFCDYLFIAATKGKDTHHLFLGLQSNADTAHEFARWLVASISREGKRRNRSEGDGRNLWYRSFCTGAASAIARRVDQMIADAKRIESEPGTALVVANLYQTELTANLAFRAQQFPKTKIGRTGSNRMNDGIVAGREYGNTVHLPRDVAGPTAKKIGP